MGRQALKLRGSARVAAVFSSGEKWVTSAKIHFESKASEHITAEPLVCLHNPRKGWERQWISENQEKLRVQGDAAAKRPAVGALNQESTVGGLVLRLAQPELAWLFGREKPETE